MLRRFQAFLVLGTSVVAIPAAAQEPSANPPTGAFPDDSEEDEEDEEEAEEGAAPADRQSARESTDPPPPATSAAPAAEPAASEGREPPEPGARPAPPADDPEVAAPGPGGWDTFASGYFRAPMAIGISPRRGPDDPTGSPKTQLSYGPNRTVDSNYYSFAYTRLQEQDWAEVFIHAKKKHVEAVIGWMGYWYQSVGFRNNDAAWAPGLAYLTLDTEFELGGLKPHVALTGGAWWPKFGYFEKYDTYTLGQMRQLGEQVKLTIPFNPDIELTLVQGFGTGRDGSSNVVAPPPYQATVGLNLLHYEHVQFSYKDYLDIGIHYNNQWTRDPNLTQQTTPGQAFADAREAHFSTVGGEVTVNVPVAGSLWVSPSYTRIKNGWALGQAGIELMHSLGGRGFASTYLGWDESPPNSMGSGSTFNFGFLYENTLSNLMGRKPGGAPELTLNVFGLFTDVKLDLPATSVITQDHIGLFKYGADLTFQGTDWLSLMLRWDELNHNLGKDGYVFSAITPRLTFSSHFMSGESIYIQYSRYRYGDQMVLAGKWPWGLPLVPGSSIVQGGPYSGQKPDMDVVRVQASVAF